MKKINNIVKLQNFKKEDIFVYCLKRYDKHDYHLQNYPDKKLLFSYFDKVYKDYKTLKYDIKKGQTILRGEIISQYSYFKDIPIYNKDNFEDLISDIFGHSIFFELTRNYNQAKRLK